MSTENGSTAHPDDIDRSASDSSADHDPTGLDVARIIARSLRSAAAGPAHSGTTYRDGEEGRGRAQGHRRHSVGPVLSGPHPDGRDPARVGAVIDSVIQKSGWESDVAVRSLFARWPELVGPEIADHCQPTGFADGVLRVRADSTAWATQLGLLAASIVRRLNEELGHGNVTVLDVAGPDVPSWSRGRRAVRDGRGPRDTYG